MQQVVQLAVLRRLDRGLRLDPAAVAAEVPGADQRDVGRAVRLLLEAGVVVATVSAPDGDVLRLTPAARRRLAGGDPGRA